MPCSQRMPLPCNNPALHCFEKERMPIPCHKLLFHTFSLCLQKSLNNLFQSDAQSPCFRNEPSQQPAQAQQFQIFLQSLHQKYSLLLQPVPLNNDCQSLKSLIDLSLFPVLSGLPFQDLPSQFCQNLLSFLNLPASHNHFQRTILSHKPLFP